MLSAFLTRPRGFRIVAALLCVALLSTLAPVAASEDSDKIKEAKSEREDARREQLEAKIELEFIKADDLEVVEALAAATELVELQQAKVDASEQRLRSTQETRSQAELALQLAQADIDLLRDRAVAAAVQSYVGLKDERAAAWLNTGDATDAAYKVALLDAVNSDTFDVLDQLRSIEEQRSDLLDQAAAATEEATAIEADLAVSLVDLKANQDTQLQLKAEVDARRERWEQALENAEAEEQRLSDWIKAEQARVEEELRRAREAALGVPRSNPGIVGTGGWAWPTSGGVASGFGPRLHPILGYYRMHSGMDIGGAQGQAIWAAHDGIVSLAGWNGGYGNSVILSHGDATTTLYAHMAAFAVSPGAYVTAGQVIGYVGSTGLSTGPHLHFEVRINGGPVNPAPYLP
jgi:murein DD-endopeptidase MepM/ murein hydrolase activator NlpD